MSKILIVEDEDAIRRVLKKVLSEENSKYKLDEAANGEEAISLIKSQHYDLILCDIKMPKKDGIDVLEFVIGYDSTIPIIMISGHGDLKTAVKAMRLGAFDYIEKPPDLNNLLTSVRSALKNTSSKKSKINPKKTVSKYEIIGDSKEIVNVKKLIEKISPTNAKVLILGPNGSGKELVARQIHSNSLRSDGPFIEVNCAAIPSELIESELFGHEKGAFTGAVDRKRGKLELVGRGTLFLDEIGDMPLKLQAKLLRVLQERQFERVGGSELIPASMRVIAATHRQLNKMIAEQEFRADLFYRLSVFPISVPSLREHREDIPLLVEHFLKKGRQELAVGRKSITEETMEILQKYSWPGNIRELGNIVERSCLMCQDEKILPSHLFFDEELQSKEKGTSRLSGTIYEMEKELIQQTLEEFNGNKTKAADSLGISIRTLRNKLNEYNEAEKE